MSDWNPIETVPKQTWFLGNWGPDQPYPTYIDEDGVWWQSPGEAIKGIDPIRTDMGDKRPAGWKPIPEEWK